MSTVDVKDTKPNTVSIANDPAFQVDLLDIMPPGLWHIWMIWAFGALGKYAEPQEYEEFLKRFSFILSQRVETGVW